MESEPHMVFWPLPQIPLLRGSSNIAEWEAAVRLHLEWHSLLSFVEDSVGQLEEVAARSEEAIELHLRNHAKAYWIVASRIGPVTPRIEILAHLLYGPSGIQGDVRLLFQLIIRRFTVSEAILLGELRSLNWVNFTSL